MNTSSNLLICVRRRHISRESDAVLWPRRREAARFAVRVALATLVGLLCSLHGAARGQTAGPEKISATEVAEAWMERSRKHRAASFQWTEKRVYEPGSVRSAALAEMHTPPGDPPLPPAPAERTEFTVDSRFLIKDDWMRLTTGGLHVSKDGTLGMRNYESAFDGDSSRFLFSHSHGAPEGYPSGTIRTERRNTDAPSFALRPLMLFLRPLDPRCNLYKRSTMVVTRREVLLPERAECVVVEDGTNYAWVDPQREFIVLRWIERHPRGYANAQVDIDYEFDSHGALYPSSWRSTMFQPDDRQVASKIIEASVLQHDSRIEPKRSDFVLEFPVGSKVFDHTSNQEYIVRDDGSARLIRGHERSLPYDALLQADASLSQRRLLPRWTLIVTLIAVATAAAFLRIRRRRRIRDREQTFHADS